MQWLGRERVTQVLLFNVDLRTCTYEELTGKPRVVKFIGVSKASLHVRGTECYLEPEIYTVIIIWGYWDPIYLLLN